MILNLTGHHLVVPGAVYPASGPAPVVQPLDIPPDYPTPAEILADLGVPLGALAVLDPATLGSRPGPIRVAPFLDRIEGFPDIPVGVGAVIVSLGVARVLRQLHLTVRRGVAILAPAMSRSHATFDLSPEVRGQIAGVTGQIRYAKQLLLFDDLTGMHDAPGLHREGDGQHPVDAAIQQLLDETGASRIDIHAWPHAVGGAPPALGMDARIGADRSGAVGGDGWAACAGALIERVQDRGMPTPGRLDGDGR